MMVPTMGTDTPRQVWFSLAPLKYPARPCTGEIVESAQLSGSHSYSWQVSKLTVCTCKASRA